MKIVLAVTQPRFLERLAPVVRLLAAANHHVHLIADVEWPAKSAPPNARIQEVTRMMDELRGEHPELVTYEFMPSRRDWLWHALASPLRKSLDAWRYLDPRYDNSPSLRHRVMSQAPAVVRSAARLPLLGAPLTRVMSAIARRLERAIPCHPSIEELLMREAPDALVVTPFMFFASSQVDYARAARKLGIPSALVVGSWDYLTTKGALYEQPDRVFVWNLAQRTEAHEFCDVPLDRIVVTGAPGYDEWFSRSPSRSRAEFCAQVGFEDDRPFLLYLCSSGFITPHEVGYVRRWIDGIRRSTDRELARAAVLIRPHPANRSQWQHFDTSNLGPIRVWPREGARPGDDVTAGYYDSIYFSAGVVGVNTSALLESGIIGRPVYTPLCDEFAGQQDSTFHFQQVKTMNGGLVRVAATFDQHLQQLAGAMRQDAAATARETREFAEALLRPNGIDVPVSPLVAEAIEALASVRVPRTAEPWPTRVLRPILFHAAAMLSRRADGASRAPIKVPTVQ